MDIQCNPMLLELLNIEKNEKEQLPGKYTKLIASHLSKMEYLHPVNRHSFTCKSCGKKGIYDAGEILINHDRFSEDADIESYIQMTGYFRCKSCNDAGNWILSTDMQGDVFMKGIMSMASGGRGFGELYLSDGSRHTYATDGEAHLLRKIKASHDDGFIWNRLGNLYHAGGRHDLAMCAFEQAIKVDPTQLETHYTIAMLLFDAEEYELAGTHFHKALLLARYYDQLDAEKLREMLAHGYTYLFDIRQKTNGKVELFAHYADHPELPSPEEHEAKSIINFEVEVFPDEPESFFPLVEMYMADRAKELPYQKRTFFRNMDRPPIKPIKEKKKKKRTKRNRKK
ncbi:hypothetical protein KP77_31320 [Jeotgalibacillus alimentarius]|uniref:Uncharacterized protein n=1 Tax=Jeotgalibacillus alimentarius TaxID=135826 RepID=A0A0C2VFY8_9BACL|nr:hypothetical protein [Jeotgalibacillus alimentarius]KIL43426.1 hypothetical protein KP77_31320 [Jeotgalibacillus alimentarius]